MDYLSYQIFDLASVYQLLIIIHLIGLAIGAGAALFSDFLFTNILKDKKINKSEFGILKLASSVVWIGLIIMLISGVAIFIGEFDRLVDSAKFQAKMTILTVLIINGIIFHFHQIPTLRKFLNKDLSKNKEFLNKHADAFFIGGAVSGVSWIAALVLGSLSSVDLSYVQIMGIYLAVVVVAIFVAKKLKVHMLGLKTKKKRIKLLELNETLFSTLIVIGILIAGTAIYTVVKAHNKKVNTNYFDEQVRIIQGFYTEHMQALGVEPFNEEIIKRCWMGETGKYDAGRLWCGTKARARIPIEPYSDDRTSSLFSILIEEVQDDGLKVYGDADPDPTGRFLMSGQNPGSQLNSTQPSDAIPRGCDLSFVHDPNGSGSTNNPDNKTSISYELECASPAREVPPGFEDSRLE